MSTQYPFRSKSAIASRYVSVLGSTMHYYEQGGGGTHLPLEKLEESNSNSNSDSERVTLLFVHGVPVHGYLWRHVMPCLSSMGRCIAVDLIGMGKSARPHIEYTIFDHIRYLQGFINALNLENIILVLHGWGSVAGFECASHCPENIKGLVFYESHIRAALEWHSLSLPIQQLLDAMSHDQIGRLDTQALLKQLMPSSMTRLLTPESWRRYEEPFLPKGSSRQPLMQYILEVPVSRVNSRVIKLIETYSAWLEESPIPKLLLYSMPGFTTTVGTLCWAKQSLSNLTLGEVVGAAHFIPESAPVEFAAKIKDWYEAKVRI